jgi:hypothetical protein
MAKGYDRKGKLSTWNLVTEGDTLYHKKNDVKLDRVTHHLQEQFMVAIQRHILNSTWVYKDYIAKAKKEGKRGG